MTLLALGKAPASVKVADPEHPMPSTTRLAEYWPVPSSASAAPFRGTSGPWPGLSLMIPLASPYQAGIAFTEELLPGLDIIPTATIAWVLENTELGQNLNGKAPPSGGSAWPPPGMGDQTPPSSGSSWPPPGKAKGDSARSKVAYLARGKVPALAAAHAATCRSRSPLAQACPLNQKGKLLPLGCRGEDTAAFWCLPKVAVPACAPRRVDEARGRLSSRR